MKSPFLTNIEIRLNIPQNNNTLITEAMKYKILLFAIAFSLSGCVLVKDAIFPPKDYGNPDVFKGIKPKIFLFPLTVAC